jgi:hypothetical protein
MERRHESDVHAGHVSSRVVAASTSNADPAVSSSEAKWRLLDRGRFSPPKAGLNGSCQNSCPVHGARGRSVRGPYGTVPSRAASEWTADSRTVPSPAASGTADSH